MSKLTYALRTRPEFVQETTKEEIDRLRKLNKKFDRFYIVKKDGEPEDVGAIINRIAREGNQTVLINFQQHKSNEVRGAAARRLDELNQPPAKPKATNRRKKTS